MLRVLCAFFALSVVKNGRKTPLLKYRYLIPLQKTNFAAVRKYVLCLCFLLVALTVMGQKKSVVVLIKSESSTGVKLNGKDMIKVYQGTFKQDYSTLTSDSAYFYPDENAFDAFGHVIIDQGDTLHIYSDLLNYNGNTKVAILTNNVKMVDKDATLTTNHFTYNTATRIGIYTDGGKLINKDNTLLSKNGYYFAKTRDSYFRYNVSLTTPDALVLTDTMRYNTVPAYHTFTAPPIFMAPRARKTRIRCTPRTGNIIPRLSRGHLARTTCIIRVLSR
jgi:lipopolysaccharide assembly outer membrane protein LptD (OstA)